MRFEPLKILSKDLLKPFKDRLPKDFRKQFSSLRESALSTRTFSFYTSISAIASSRIEGETMEIDSYLKHKMQKVKFQPSLIQRPNDLYSAYEFAQSHSLNPKNFALSHKKIAAHLLPVPAQGKLRKMEMLILEQPTQRIRYEAALANDVPKLYATLWKDIDFLLEAKLSIAEAFYFASHIHLTFVKIHPFEDGNGRGGRLLEKWFLAEKLRTQSWYIQSEMYYYKNVEKYYSNLNRLGFDFSGLDYSKALPFLMMLPKALGMR